ncbi:MAG: type secretion protein [Pseudomonas sp.]|nr:type secretion protein [Pseudomonas sp.]
MSRVASISHVLLVALAGWLAAQCVLQVWHGPTRSAAPTVPTAPAARMLSGHWQPGPVISNDLPLTTLAVQYLGGFKARELSSTVVVLRFEQRQRTLARGQRLAPGILLQDIDELGLVFDNNGKRERLPWPAQRPSFGFKQQG